MKACVLPSASSACDLMSGDVRALPRVFAHTLGRAALIGLGITLAGEQDSAKVTKYALGAAVAIEVFALAWAGIHTKR